MGLFGIIGLWIFLVIIVGTAINNFLFGTIVITLLYAIIIVGVILDGKYKKNEKQKERDAYWEDYIKIEKTLMINDGEFIDNYIVKDSGDVVHLLRCNVNRNEISSFLLSDGKDLVFNERLFYIKINKDSVLSFVKGKWGYELKLDTGKILIFNEEHICKYIREKFNINEKTGYLIKDNATLDVDTNVKIVENIGV